MSKMSVSRALVELKTLEKRINKTIENLNPIGLMLGQSPESGIQSKQEFEKSARAGYQQVNDLIKRRRQIKNAIVQSNASVQVQIAGEKMTVAEAIERKASITLEKELKNNLWKKFSEKSAQLEEHNQKVNRQLFQLLQATYAKPEHEVKAEDHDTIAIPFKENNLATLIDPLQLKATLFALEAQIDAFEAEVDIALTESNARHEISVSD
jgi:hypothetical protein